ncbi:MAG: hypothetical protein JWQ28_3074 [Pedobacter sp.]|jgi:hypothetical protein|nr:hypothetical protein [Pedobacter sp.]
MRQIPFVLLALLLTAFFPLSQALAQQDFLVKGVVMESGTMNRIALAEITNKRNNFVVGSNDMGIFEIKASVGDTLVIVKRDFSDRQVRVVGPMDVVVKLNRTTLNTVNIYGQSKKQEMNQIKQDFRDKGSFYAGKPPLLSYVFTPLTAIYELFGKTPKNARRFNKYYNTELQQSEIDDFFNETLIQKETDLRGKDLEQFMLNYRPDYEQAKKWTEYDAIKYIRDNYAKYKASIKK